MVCLVFFPRPMVRWLTSDKESSSINPFACTAKKPEEVTQILKKVDPRKIEAIFISTTTDPSFVRKDSAGVVM